MRQAVKALRAKREDDWSKVGFALCWVVNSMPNFSKIRRTAIPLQRFNPLLKQKQRPVSEAAKDAGFDALWNSLPETPK